MARQLLEDPAGGSWWTRRSHICMQKTLRGQLGSKTDCTTPQGSSTEKKASKPLVVKTGGNCSSKRNSHPHRRASWKDPQGPTMCTNPPTQESAPEGPDLLGGRGGNESWPRAQQAALFPLGPLRHIQYHTAVMWVALPW